MNHSFQVISNGFRSSWRILNISIRSENNHIGYFERKSWSARKKDSKSRNVCYITIDIFAHLLPNFRKILHIHLPHYTLWQQFYRGLSACQVKTERDSVTGSERQQLCQWSRVLSSFPVASAHWQFSDVFMSRNLLWPTEIINFIIRTMFFRCLQKLIQAP